jgi:hypothetical protein
VGEGVAGVHALVHVSDDREPVLRNGPDDQSHPERPAAVATAKQSCARPRRLRAARLVLAIPSLAQKRERDCTRTIAVLLGRNKELKSVRANIIWSRSAS